MSEKELDMNELINDFNEYSTDYSKSACSYYEDYLRNYQKEKLELEDRINNAIEYINFLAIGTQGIKEELLDKCEMGMIKFNNTMWGEEILDLLKGDKE